MFSQKKKKHWKKRREKSVIAESKRTLKKKIWKDKFNSLNKSTTLPMKLSKILEQVSTQKEKVLKPFWTQASKEISKKLWIHTEKDFVNLISNSSSNLPEINSTEKSWFSIKQKLSQKSKLLKNAFPLSQYSIQGSPMVSDVTQLKEESKNKLIKTLKIRIFPNEKETLELQKMFDQFRWYYNGITNIFNNLKTDEKEKLRFGTKYSMFSIKNLFKKHKFTEEIIDLGNSKRLIFQEFVFDENVNKFPIPDWWDSVYERLQRGAVCKFVSSLNSAVSNLKNGNIKKFSMKFRSSKNVTNYLHFEDKNFPAFIKKIKSRYWFTNTKGKRMNIPFSKVFEENKKSLEIIYEKDTGRYFIHCAVDRNWFPEEDRRSSENQPNRLFSEEEKIKSTNEESKSDEPKEKRVISLDPGIRKFLTGYDPNGKVLFIGEKACNKLSTLLEQADLLKSKKKKLRKYRKIKNLISELHWKVSSFLVKNYDSILLPDFRTSQMVLKKKPGSKKKTISKKTRRLMNMFSFYKFKEKLIYKCSNKSKELYIVDESYTSKTCGFCGKLNNVGSSEVYNCDYCNLEIDRDVNGARNILIKNLALR
jgi:IS605 OrfB family transposase